MSETPAAFLPFAPTPDRDSRPYWDALAQGRFELQRCQACRKPCTQLAPPHCVRSSTREEQNIRGAGPKHTVEEGNDSGTRNPHVLVPRPAELPGFGMPQHNEEGGRQAAVLPSEAEVRPRQVE